MPAVADRTDPFAAVIGSDRGQRNQGAGTVIVFQPLVTVDLTAAGVPLRAVIDFSDSCQGETHAPYGLTDMMPEGSSRYLHACAVMDDQVAPAVKALFAATDSDPERRQPDTLEMWFMPTFLANFNGPQLLSVTADWSDCYTGYGGSIPATVTGCDDSDAADPDRAAVMRENHLSNVAGALLDSALPAVERLLAELRLHDPSLPAN